MIKIREIFNLKKGTLQSSKCTPGEYSFITASKEWKTHNEFEYDCEALIFAAAASGSLGRTHYINGKFVSSDLCFIITPKNQKKYPIDLKFYHIIFNTLKDDIVKNTKAGTSKEAIGLKSLGEYELPYISIEKQKEISTKFNSTTEISELLLLEQSNQLDLIKDLRQAFLREAMQGVLVSNDTSDGKTGADLLVEVQAEKAQMVKEKKIKKPKPLAPITEEEIPFDIPDNWTWCRLGQLTENIVYGTSVKTKDKGEIPVLRMGNITTNGKILLNKLKYTDSTINDLPALYLKFNDLLFNRTNSFELVGKSAVFDLNERYTCASYLIIVRFLNTNFSNFICRYINSNLCRVYQLEPNIIQQNGQANFNGTKLANIIIPLPPLEIQECIVSKLDELMGYCDALEQQVKESQKVNELLLQQVLREALEGKPSEDNVAEEVEDYQTMVAEVFGTTDKVHSINNPDLEIAAMVYLMKSGLGLNYGEVALQKTVYNTSYMTPNMYSKKHEFKNYHYGTYSEELKGDIQSNPYLMVQQLKGGKEVYVIDPEKEKEILDVLSKKENKRFVMAINSLLQIYSLPFINKETDKIELFNTVLKIYADLKTTNVDFVYQAMKDWKIKQTGFKSKAEKFSKEDTEKMIELLLNRGVIK